MTDKLSLYNGALRLLGEQRLDTLSDSIESRRVLDDLWPDSIYYCLEQGLWNFSIRAIEISSDPSFSPSFGYTYAFSKPTDMLRISAVWQDSSESDALSLYATEGNYLYANLDPLYIRYVSSDANYGMNIGKWTLTFAKYVEAHMAAEAAPRITQGDVNKMQELRKLEHSRLMDANNRNVMDQPARFPPEGSWCRSRRGGLTGRSSLSGTGRGL